MEKNGNTLVSWPKRLHICFDNAVGENINQNVFFYLAAFVHHGIFHTVTVGTLLVGHTHNINDQQFSVWSRYLDKHPCMTLSEMIKAFESNYTGSVKEAADNKTVKLQATTPSATHINPSSTQSVSGVTSEIETIPSTEPRMEIDPGLPSKEKRSILSLLPKLIQDLVDAGVKAKPFVERTEECANIAGWLTSDFLKKKGKVFEGIGCIVTMTCEPVEQTQAFNLLEKISE